MQSLIEKSINATKFLIENTADPKVGRQNNDTVLMVAISKGNSFETVKLFTYRMKYVAHLYSFASCVYFCYSQSTMKLRRCSFKRELI